MKQLTKDKPNEPVIESSLKNALAGFKYSYKKYALFIIDRKVRMIPDDSPKINKTHEKYPNNFVGLYDKDIPVSALRDDIEYFFNSFFLETK